LDPPKEGVEGVDLFEIQRWRNRGSGARETGSERHYRRGRTRDLQTRGLLAGGVGTRGKLNRRGHDDGMRGWLVAPRSENGGASAGEGKLAAERLLRACRDCRGALAAMTGGGVVQLWWTPSLRTYGVVVVEIYGSLNEPWELDRVAG
jgi:hypothetical protein